MLYTYKAILRGNHLEWNDTPPADLTPERAIAVHVTILEEPEYLTQPTLPGQQMAMILEQLAQVDAFTEISDPQAWEREVRQDRILPDREL